MQRYRNILNKKYIITGMFSCPPNSRNEDGYKKESVGTAELLSVLRYSAYPQPDNKQQPHAILSTYNYKNDFSLCSCPIGIMQKNYYKDTEVFWTMGTLFS